MSKASFAYQKLYGDSLKETAVGDYIQELEAERAKLMLYIGNLWRSNRPLSYSEKDHIENPLVNIIKDSEKELIKIYLKQKHKGE